MDSLTRFNVISSRIRLARNIDGIAFPSNPKGIDHEKRMRLPDGIERLLRGTFDYDYFHLRDLSDTQIKALVERHIISPSLVHNRQEGAGIVERNECLSFLINEEDHIREQCVEKGFNLARAYDRLSEFDDIIVNRLPIAYDDRLGFLTSCPTNLGTGMRASTMLFLPALRHANAIEDTVRVFRERYGLTIRGIYGEGSSAQGDVYQLSNTRSLGATEWEIIEIIERATLAMCKAEEVARERLMAERGEEIKDKIQHSFNTLSTAYSLTSEALMALISDVKLGVIFGLVPLADTAPLDKLTMLFSASSLTLKIGECAPSVRDITRAKLVREILSEVI
ncbi:MAG: ATP--guanido phosphotransferase [Clostridia bacterium]|nr:ATP--guanido phosphotransferase [Clostridia bacterium]MBO7222021.1 ATP--guanido phosphotransferase [Clostridia bacterium]